MILAPTIEKLKENLCFWFWGPDFEAAGPDFEAGRKYSIPGADLNVVFSKDFAPYFSVLNSLYSIFVFDV